VATQNPPGRQSLGASHKNTTLAPAGLLGDIRSAVRSHSLVRIAGFVLAVCRCQRSVEVPQQWVLVQENPRKPSKAAAADSPKAVSAGASAKAPAAGVEAPAAGVTKGAAAASNQAAPNVSTKAVPGESPSRSADLLHNYRQLSGRVADVSWQAFNVADSGFMKLVLAPTKHNTLLRRFRNKLNGEGYKTPGYMDLRVINTDSQEGSSPCAFGIGKPADSLRVGYAAGAVLLTQTNEELANIMACEMGHSVACHEAERKSWRLLLNTVYFGSLVASSSIGLLPLAAAAVGIDAVVNKVIVGIWLHRRQQYKADAMGAAISMAAGCSADSIISYMQRAYLAEVYDKTLHFKATDATLTRGLPDLSASLRQLVPNSGLPEKIPVTLQELQARICISASEAKRLSPEAKTKFDAEVKAIEHILVLILHSIREPVQRWVHSYPDWLDRIAYVQSLSILKAAQPIQKKQTSKMDALQKSLTPLQASEHWPQAVKCMGVKDLDAKEKYDYRLEVRKASEADLSSAVGQHNMMASGKHGWISWKQACINKFCSLTEHL